MKHVGIVGLGLIGGSLALNAKKHFANCMTYGADLDSTHLKEAQELGWIDKELTTADFPKLDLLLLAIPVDALQEQLANYLNLLSPQGLLIDFGSTKAALCQQLKNHPKRHQYLATHPIAGTEFSGPQAAFTSLFEHKTQILCETEKTAADLLDRAVSWFKKMKMQLIVMDPEEHDKHIAYVSHLSHISSFMLGKTVLEKETDQSTIFELAGSGFESTVRLAKSSPEMWTPIFKVNKPYILETLKEYINNLKNFQNLIEDDNFDAVFQEMKTINSIRGVLEGITNKNSTYGK